MAPQSERRPARLSSGQTRPLLSVCICTLRRPEGLRELLAHLDRQKLPADLEHGVEIIIVENETDGPAEAVCAAYARAGRFPIRFAAEAPRGIAFARNKCLDMASASDFIVFIDDDEFPEPDWLVQLHSAQARLQADVVAGPVVASYVEPPPAWLKNGRFHHLPRHPTGERLSWCATGNVLFRAALVRDTPLRFDEDLGLSGGEDVLFFERASRAGYRITWCDEAIVYERVPTDRMTVGWVLQRAYRLGNSECMIDRRLDGASAAWLRRLPTALAHIVLSSAAVPLAFIAGRGVVVGRLRKIMVGCGRIAGLLGLRYQEYRARGSRVAPRLGAEK